MTDEKKKTLVPIGEKIAVELVEVKEEILGGIIIDTGGDSNSFRRATVLAVGSGKNVRAQFSIGDTVFIKKNCGTNIKHQGCYYMILYHDDVIAKVSEGEVPTDVLKTEEEALSLMVKAFSDLWQRTISPIHILSPLPGQCTDTNHIGWRPTVTYSSTTEHECVCKTGCCDEKGQEA